MAEKSIEKRKISKKELEKGMEKDMHIPSEIIDSLRLFAIEKRLNTAQVKAIFNEEISEKIAVPENSVPVEIFSSKKLSALEAIVKYLKEEKGWTFAKTAAITERSSKTIWATYAKARKKMPENFHLIMPIDHIPLSILKDRDLGVQESIVRYLKENTGLNYHKIAVLLGRNDRTVWTAYDRAIKKSKSIVQRK